MHTASHTFQYPLRVVPVTPSKPAESAAPAPAVQAEHHPRPAITPATPRA